jgi:heme/copper-type cytochrome/quinol oxidase subunit 3
MRILVTQNKSKLLKAIQFNPEQHPFHLVPPSPWPYLISWSTCYLIYVLVHKFHGYSIPNSPCIYCWTNYIVARYIWTFALISWFWDIIIEATYEGRHTVAVQQNIRIGFALFIVSEIIFFAAFFISYFYLALWPSIEIGGVWPPIGVKTLWAWGLPFVNTLILLSSGITVTWAHIIVVTPYHNKQIYYLPDLWYNGYIHIDEEANIDPDTFIEQQQPWRYNARYIVAIALALTIILGLLFTYIQLYEYKHAKFSISTTVYGSLFYIITGFHGLHVLIGTIILAVCLLRHIFYHFTRDHHLGLELAIWYWHFVDVVWIFLFISLYWWAI